MNESRHLVEAKLESRTDRSGGPDACWPWTGGCGQRDQPRVWLLGKGHQARIVQWELINGDLPKGRTVTMQCKVARCMNPAHMKLRARKDDVARFWEKVEKTDGCWIWKGTVSVGAPGYAVFHVGDHGLVFAHRYSYELAYGKIEGHVPGHPELEICVCHRCDNTVCVRPDHLFLGSDKDNMHDMLAKGRGHWQKARANMERLAAKAMGVSDGG